MIYIFICIHSRCVHGYKKWVMFPPDIDEEILFLISGSFLFPDRVLTQIEWFEHVYPRLNEWNILHKCII